MVDPKDAVDAAADTVRDVTEAAESTVREVTEAADRRVRELGSYIREQRKNSQLSLRNLAKQAGVSNPYLSQIERGLRKPSAEILQSIAGALRISAETLYVKAGILEERESDLASAILADQTITETQRRALLEVYRSFKAEGKGEERSPAAAPAPVEDPPTSEAEEQAS